MIILTRNNQNRQNLNGGFEKVASRTHDVNVFEGVAMISPRLSTSAFFDVVDDSKYPWYGLGFYLVLKYVASLGVAPTVPCKNVCRISFMISRQREFLPDYLFLRILAFLDCHDASMPPKRPNRHRGMPDSWSDATSHCP